MASIGNNINADYANTRDSFFTAGEMEYYEQLLRSPYERSIRDNMKKEKASFLHRKAVNLIERAEAGEFTDEEMYIVEKMISHYLYAIEDLHMELVKGLSVDEDEMAM